MRTFVSPFLAIATLACSPANVGSPDSGPSVAQACTQEAYARCARYQSCSPILLPLRYGDVGTCQSILQQDCVSSLEAPGGGSTVASIMACQSEIATWACSDYIYGTNAPPDCVAPGGSTRAGEPARCPRSVRRSSAPSFPAPRAASARTPRRRATPARSSRRAVRA
jgi:hypothetical protein